MKSFKFNGRVWDYPSKKQEFCHMVGYLSGSELKDYINGLKSEEPVVYLNNHKVLDEALAELKDDCESLAQQPKGALEMIANTAYFMHCFASHTGSEDFAWDLTQKYTKIARGRGYTGCL